MVQDILLVEQIFGHMIFMVDDVLILILMQILIEMVFQILLMRILMEIIMTIVMTSGHIMNTIEVGCDIVHDNLILRGILIEILVKIF